MKSAYGIIVLGSGGAGLVAALRAKELGADVLLVSKSPLGLNSCTTYAGGGFSYAGPGGDIAEHQRKTAETGRNVNDPELLRVFAQEGPEAVASLQRWGVQLYEYENGGSVAHGSPIPGVGGLGMTYPLVEEMRRQQLPSLEGWMAVEILCDDSRVTGVQLICLSDGRTETVNAKAIIVATGGGGRIYSRTNNPTGTTGDGYHLMRQLGLSFRDMEFVQFYPLGLAEPELPLWFIDLGIIDKAPLVDRSGTEFLLEQLHNWGLATGREGNLYARDRCSISILQQYLSGDEAVLHLEKLTAEDWSNRYLSSVLRLNRPVTFDFTKRPVRVKPLQHYMSGGVVIDTHGATAIPGLYACGEVTGGVDGANRIGGNALTNITLFGQRSATAAVAYCIEVPAKAAPPNYAEYEALQIWHKNSNGSSPIALRRRLQETMDLHVAPLRDAAGLETALKTIADIAQEIPLISLGETQALREALELQSLLTTAELVATAALQREESRGVHYRLDYPSEDPAWKKTVYVK